MLCTLDSEIFAAGVVSQCLCAFRKQQGKFLGVIIISSGLESFFTAEVTVWFGSHPQNKSVWWDFDNSDGTEMTVHVTWNQVEVESQPCLDCDSAPGRKDNAGVVDWTPTSTCCLAASASFPGLFPGCWTLSTACLFTWNICHVHCPFFFFFFFSVIALCVYMQIKFTS